jgi:hypothetical protein
MTNSSASAVKLRPDTETLEKGTGYRKILELDFTEIIPFVISNIRKRSAIPLFYLIFNTASLLFIIIFTIGSIRNGQINAGRAGWQIILGIVAGSILVIPPHEILHGLAYWLLGARKIRFGMDLQQFIFYVTADRFPISRKELAFLAMTPFVVINLLIITLTVTWVPQLTLFFTTMLVSHNIMCIGDFAMISYAFSRKGKLYTFDDVDKKKSYFFERLG